ncbi:MAG: hypothetical protein HYU67_03670 [Flavobacteriia bacterium]|nr:hypothetical protein [Flavobacteriia bacterium]
MKTNEKMKIWSLIFILLVVFSCKKEKQDKENIEEYTASAADNSLAENTSEEVETISDEAAAGKMAFVSYSSSCVNITYDSLSAVKSIIIDFGPENCLCEDGKYRRGKVIVTYEGSYFEEGSVKTKTTDNYFVNDNQIIGSKTVTNVGNLSHHIVANWEIIKADNGGTITWNSERDRVQIAGIETPDFRGDDTYEISGSASGVNAKGKNYSLLITENLIKEVACKWIKAGVISKTVEDKVGTIDFGDGECDNQAVVTRNGKTKTITLK